MAKCSLIFNGQFLQMRTLRDSLPIKQVNKTIINFYKDEQLTAEKEDCLKELPRSSFDLNQVGDFPRTIWNLVTSPQDNFSLLSGSLFIFLLEDPASNRIKNDL